MPKRSPQEELEEGLMEAEEALPSQEVVASLRGERRKEEDPREQGDERSSSATLRSSAHKQHCKASKSLERARVSGTS